MSIESVPSPRSGKLWTRDDDCDDKNRVKTRDDDRGDVYECNKVKRCNSTCPASNEKYSVVCDFDGRWRRWWTGRGDKWPIECDCGENCGPPSLEFPTTEFEGCD